MGTRVEATEVQRRKEQGAGRSTVASCFVTRPLLPPSPGSLLLLHLYPPPVYYAHFSLITYHRQAPPAGHALCQALQTMGSSGKKGLHPVGCGSCVAHRGQKG